MFIAENKTTTPTLTPDSSDVESCREGEDEYDSDPDFWQSSQSQNLDNVLASSEREEGEVEEEEEEEEECDYNVVENTTTSRVSSDVGRGAAPKPQIGRVRGQTDREDDATVKSLARPNLLRRSVSFFPKGKDCGRPKEREVADGATSEVGSPKSSQIVESSADPPSRSEKRCNVASGEGAGGSADNGERHTGARGSKKLKFGDVSIDSPPNSGGAWGEEMSNHPALTTPWTFPLED